MPAPTPAPHDPAAGAAGATSSDTSATTGTSTATGPTAGALRGPRALVVPMNRILRTGAVSALVALPVATVVGYLIGGTAGAWGALLGIGISVAFFAVTVAVALATARTRHTSMLGLAVVASWIVKVGLLIGALAYLRGQDFYSRPALFVALLVGTTGTLLLEARVVATTQVPYIETDQR